MSICDRCIHDEVCGLEDNHEDAMTFCADMKPKDILDKLNEIIEPLRQLDLDEMSNIEWQILQVIDKYKSEMRTKNDI